MRNPKASFFCRLAPLASLGCAMMADSSACQIPVFRYALERWLPDSYMLLVPPDEQLDDSQQAAVAFLRDSVRSGANLRILPRTPGSATDDTAAIELYVPQSAAAKDAPIWSGPLTMANARRVVNSPARSELVKRILAGQSTVWVLVETGDAEEDARALATLEGAVATAKTTVRLPDGIIGKNAATLRTLSDEKLDDVLMSALPLGIDFSIVTIARDDPEEAVFLQMLTSVEDDLHQFTDQVLVFPVFGRGRVMEPIIGAGLNPKTVLNYANYICSACSCEVKEQNPGMDLLVSADWQAAIEGRELVIDKSLPPLEGAAGILGGEQNDELATEDEARPRPFRNLAIALGIALIAIASLSFALRPRS